MLTDPYCPRGGAQLKGIDAVVAQYPDISVVVNGNQCFFADDRNSAIAGANGDITDKCHGRIVRFGQLDVAVSSDNYDTTTSPAGSELAAPEPIPGMNPSDPLSRGGNYVALYAAQKGSLWLPVECRLLQAFLTSLPAIRTPQWAACRQTLRGDKQEPKFNPLALRRSRVTAKKCSSLPHNQPEVVTAATWLLMPRSLASKICQAGERVKSNCCSLMALLPWPWRTRMDQMLLRRLSKEVSIAAFHFTT